MLGVDYSAQSVRFARRIERARRRLADESEEGLEEEGNDGVKEEGIQGEKEAGEEEEYEGEGEGEEVDVHFAEHDILHDPATALLKARYSHSVREGWDVVLDKGTFDAISLSAETLDTNTNSANANANGSGSAQQPRRVDKVYGTRILPLVREGGVFLITSCNWTEAELRSWFEGDGTVQEIPPSTTTTTTASGEEEGQQQHEYWGFEAVGRVEYRSFSFGGVKGQTISSLCFRKVRKSR